MPTFALIYHVVPDYIARRAAFRDDHIRLAQAAVARGDLLMGGAFADPPDTALLIWRVPDRAAIEEFVAFDPYVANGLVTTWEIREWTVVIGAP